MLKRAWVFYNRMLVKYNYRWFGTSAPCFYFDLPVSAWRMNELPPKTNDGLTKNGPLETRQCRSGVQLMKKNI
ncbi:MAG: hypothetical protein JWP78_3096 [Mucilaginibacter sp.]|nr:hypothetical protein [Mucilaginibacter sp.]